MKNLYLFLNFFNFFNFFQGWLGFTLALTAWAWPLRALKQSKPGQLEPQNIHSPN